MVKLSWATSTAYSTRCDAIFVCIHRRPTGWQPIKHARGSESFSFNFLLLLLLIFRLSFHSVLAFAWWLFFSCLFSHFGMSFGDANQHYLGGYYFQQCDTDKLIKCTYCIHSIGSTPPHFPFCQFSPTTVRIPVDHEQTIKYEHHLYTLYRQSSKKAREPNKSVYGYVCKRYQSDFFLFEIKSIVCLPNDFPAKDEDNSIIYNIFWSKNKIWTQWFWFLPLQYNGSPILVSHRCQIKCLKIACDRMWMIDNAKLSTDMRSTQTRPHE